ncbi:MAG: hypothetical protein HQL30_10175 [Candidatus Omnitrophica bacterium]|nr:hypothetical protein [Candidatus Omnitrophota bacterium]
MSRKMLIISLLFMAAAAVAAPRVFAAYKVAGAELLGGGVSFDDAYPGIIGLPLTQEEVDLFIGAIGPIEEWVGLNSAAWNAVGSSGDFLKDLKILPVWETLGLGGAEFMTVLVKINTARDISSGTLSAAKMKEQLERYRAHLNDNGLFIGDLAVIKQQITNLEKVVEALEKYPTENIRIYEANKATIVAGVDRFNRIGK